MVSSVVGGFRRGGNVQHVGETEDQAVISKGQQSPQANYCLTGKAFSNKSPFHILPLSI